MLASINENFHVIVLDIILCRYKLRTIHSMVNTTSIIRWSIVIFLVGILINFTQTGTIFPGSFITSDINGKYKQQVITTKIKDF